MSKQETSKYYKKKVCEYPVRFLKNVRTEWTLDVLERMRSLRTVWVISNFMDVVLLGLSCVERQ